MKLKKILRENLLLILTILSVFIGIALGFSLRPLNPEKKVITIIGFPGEILMNMLKMVIIPLIVASLISG